MQSISTFLLGGFLAAAAPLGAAQQAGTQPARSAMRANQQAADLMNTINKSEIATAKMMADHTQNAQVKDFAAMLASDHEQAQTRLESTASAGNISLHEGPMMMRRDRATEKHLKAMKPDAADRAYAASQVREHEHAIAQLTKLQPEVTDPQLKTEIQDYLPVLRKHLAEAKKLQSELHKPMDPGK